MLSLNEALPRAIWSYVGENSNEFRLILRQNNINPLDFSVILAYKPKNVNQWFRLRRYNGKSHEHGNKLEKERFYDFHIHIATDRYQKLGAREDAYAEPTDRYSSRTGALDCMFQDCGFDIPSDPQGQLF